MKTPTAGVCLYLSLSLSPLASATTAPAEADAAIETVTVTAHRLPSPWSPLPVVERNVADEPAVGTDALRDLPAFAISQAGSLGTVSQVRVRGAEANHLLVLMDGVEIMDPSTDAGFNFANLNLAGVDRLEFLPGAQSAIWGSDALAGVLQLSSRPARDARRITAEGGSFDSRYLSAQLAEVEDGHYYNLSAADFRTDGTNTARRGSEEDGHENRALMLSAGLDRERWSSRGLVRHTQTRSEFDPAPFPDYLPVDGDYENRHEALLVMAGLDLRSASGFWEERLTLSVLDTDNEAFDDGNQNSSTDGKRWKVSSVTRLNPTERQQVDLILEHERERFDQRGEASAFGDPNQSQTIRTSSAGVEYLIAPTDAWRLSASARYDRNSEFANASSYRLAGSYLWREDTRLWLALGTGVKNPSFVDRFGFTPDSFIGNPQLEAETNEHVSIGAEHRSGPWQLNLTLFDDRLEDEINGFYFDAEAGGFTAVNQQGTSRRRGAELETARHWRSGNLRVGASYVDSEDPDGSREIRRPQWLGFARLSQTWGRADLGLDVYQVDEQLDTDFAPFPTVNVRLEPYTLVNAQVRMPLTAQLDVTLRASNLLDERYEDQLGYRGPGRAVYLKLGVDL